MRQRLGTCPIIASSLLKLITYDISVPQCNHNQPREELEANPEYAGLDFCLLTPDWTSKQGFYASDTASLQARARWNRKWLRERPEKEIVLVAHGDCLRYITEGYNSGTPWANAEVRAYTFKCEEEEDKEGEAWLVPLPVKQSSVVAKEGADEPTSSEMTY